MTIDWQPGIVGLIALVIASASLAYTVYGKRKESYENILEHRVEELERKEETCAAKVEHLMEEVTNLRRMNQDLLLRLVGRALILPPGSTPEGS